MSELAGRCAANDAWQPEYPMARLSSWRAGGAAAWLFSPRRLAAGRDNPMLTLPYALPPQAARRPGSEAPLFVGYGSNLLVRDGGYDGIVVRTAPGLARLALNADRTVDAAAGVGCPKLARFCAGQGLDAAFFAGIPGTVGGALAMNAGCYGGETWQYVERARILQGGGERELPPAAFEIGYRCAVYKQSAAVYFTGARFRFPESGKTQAAEKVKTLLQTRARAQPLGAASAGSVFCNPPGDSAGRLIEQCGLKNARIGGAVVSARHANFIVNDRAASAADIEALILHVQTEVAEKTGTLLTPEVRIVGRAA